MEKEHKFCVRRRQKKLQLAKNDETEHRSSNWLNVQRIIEIARQSCCRLGQHKERQEKTKIRVQRCIWGRKGRVLWGHCWGKSYVWVEKAYLKASFWDNKPVSLLLETRPNIILCDLETCISSLITTQEICLLSKKQETIVAWGLRVAKEKETHLLSWSPILTFYLLASWIVSWSQDLEGIQAALGWWFRLTVGLATPVWVAACVISCLNLPAFNEVFDGLFMCLPGRKK